MKPILYFLFFSVFMQAQNTIPEKEILDVLDHSNSGTYSWFIPLGHPYSYLIDCRLNVFRSDNAEWAIAAEKLGYNPRGGYVELEIYYYGNCLKNLEEENGNVTNVQIVYPIDIENHEATTDGEVLKPDAKFWLVRDQKVPLTHDRAAYKNAGIELGELEPGEISIGEAARLAMLQYSDFFRATDAELYKCIHGDLKKILVLDEWYHKDHNWPVIIFPEDNLKKTYEFNKALMEQNGMSLDDFLKLMEEQNKESEKLNDENYANNRPSSYETWQLIAKVISQNNPALYKPTLKPNTHWKNWPDSGSL
ncbi:DUF7003 family protein [Flavobacterium sp. RHBU_24]|uniref:DUF7003 family protein n=1 Tax=Flavobacterium sp. RHBU_24 TaxID=3391185 RepID=UPI0039854E49